MNVFKNKKIKDILREYDYLYEFDKETDYDFEELIEIIEDGMTDYEGDYWHFENNENRTRCIQALKHVYKSIN